MKWRLHQYEREQYEVWEYDDNDQHTDAVLYCGHSEVGKLLAERIVALSDLQAIVDKYPKTEDGVSVVPGMVTYCDDSRSFSFAHHWDIRLGSGESFDAHCRNDNERQYSTPEAVEAARDED